MSNEQNNAAPVSKFIEQANALLRLDDANALVPHGIGGFARELLTEAIRLLSEAPAAAPAPAVPEIDYQALIRAAYATNNKWAKGTNGCIAFSRGAEWFRELMLAATPAAPSQEPVTLTDEDIDNLARKHAGDPSSSGAWGSTYEFEPSELRAFVNEIADLREKEWK